MIFTRIYINQDYYTDIMLPAVPAVGNVLELWNHKGVLEPVLVKVKSVIFTNTWEDTNINILITTERVDSNE